MVEKYCPWINAASQGKEPGWRMMLRVLQHSGKSTSGAASVYSTTSAAASSERSEALTLAERDAEDDSKLKKLRRLKSMYFGKGKKEKERERAKSVAKSLAESEASKQ